MEREFINQRATLGAVIKALSTVGSSSSSSSSSSDDAIGWRIQEALAPWEGNYTSTTTTTTTTTTASSTVQEGE